MRKLNNWLSEQYIMAFRYFPFVQVILLYKIYDRRDQIRLENGTIGEGMDIPANREILGENYEYLTIKNNPSDIANKVMDMVQKRIKMAEISKSNRSKVRKSYGMSVMIDSYIELLES